MTWSRIAELYGEAVVEGAGAMRTAELYVEAIVSNVCTPPNDDWAEAQVLTGSSGTVSGDNSCATLEPGEPTVSPASTVWYTWVAPADGVVEFTAVGGAGGTHPSSPTLSVQLEAFTGPDLAGLTAVSSSSDSITFAVTEAVTYYIRMNSTNDSEFGPFDLSWDFVASCPDNSVWYAYTPSATGETTFFIDAEGLSVILEVFTGNDLESLVGPIASYEGSDPLSPTMVPVDGDTTYWLRTYNSVPGESGPFTLTWSLDPFDPVIVDLDAIPLDAKLGCSQHVAYIQDKCNGRRLCELLDISNLYYDRRLDDISEAFVEIPITGDMDDPCCSCLGEVEPWCHLLTIVREGDGVVWSGPVQRVIYGFDKVRIEARDKLAWLQVRVNEVPVGFNEDSPNVSTPLTTIAKMICEVAMIDDGDSPCFLDCVVDAQQGPPMNMYFEAYEGPTAFDDFQTLAEAGVDYTVVNQCLILTGEELPPRPIGTLTDEMILGDVNIIKDGTLMANRVFVRWTGDDDCPGKCAPQSAVPCPFPYDACCPCPAVRDIADAATACYGRIERLIPTDAALSDVESAGIVAQAYLDANTTSARFIEFPSGTRLSPETPWRLNDMIPGQRIDVALSKLCLPVFQSFKLQQVSVEDGESGEEISIDLKSLDVDTGV